ncbi:hypothetical protein GG804_18675 [Sphingomonas histidinilytica]|uniref:hypothetical protein n=1 Tax=Rhizorhabdus histidinilytica TaxID=439228 RepID=UPI001ADB899F|nr:hypothetical protein [Rhizorhabdus histidinilytica]MBO9378796.1 hypothetical protein [Rhizorhabdus histidinilytica]
MSYRPVPLAIIAAVALPAGASARSTQLDIDRLRNETVHEVARRAILAVDKEGRPLTFVLRIGRGQFLPPHGAQGGLRILTVVSGTLSWGDGDKVDQAAERRLGPGSVIVVPAVGGQHWAAARDGDVLLQGVFVRDGALTPEAAAQLAR